MADTAGLPNPESHRLIAQFMSASSPLEEYLRQGGALTPLQLQSICTTISGLQTFVDIWKSKHGQ